MNQIFNTVDQITFLYFNCYDSIDLMVIIHNITYYSIISGAMFIILTLFAIAFVTHLLFLSFIMNEYVAIGQIYFMSLAFGKMYILF